MTKTAEELAQKAQSAIATLASQTQPAEAVQPQKVTSLDDESAAIVNKLFVELQSIFPAWKQAWPTEKAMDAAKKTWVKAFATAGIRDLEQIRFGIMKCRSLAEDFIPSVGRFILLCTPAPEEVGLPPLRAAWDDAVRFSHPAASYKWSHPVVAHAAHEVGNDAMQNLPESRSKELFEKAYLAAVKDFLGGKIFKELPKELPAEVSGVYCRATARKKIDELKKILGKK